MTRLLTCVAACLCCLMLLVARPAIAADVPTIAAAADLKFALAEVAEGFRKDTGHAVKLVFGSSGAFTAQIENGAPFEMLLSADEQYIFQLSDKGLTRDRGALYAIGRIVLFAPLGSSLKVDAAMTDLRAALSDGRLKRFAIANPEHAPYGRAARAALRHAGLWPGVEPRLVLGENAGQAMQFASSGSSQGGIVPLSLSRAPELAKLGSFALLPAEWHADEPLRQRMALTRKVGPTAEAFYRYLQQPTARETLARYGFVLPDQAKR